MGGEPMDYASSGVDIDAEGKAISSLIDALGGSVRKRGQKGEIVVQRLQKAAQKRPKRENSEM